MVRLFYSIIFILSFSALIFSEEINANLICENNNVTAGDFFQINLNVTGSNNDIEIKDMNNSDNSSIQIRKSGTMSSVSIVNGVMTSSITFVYLVSISKTGDFEIGPFVLNIKGKEYKTNTIKVNVTESSNNTNQTTYNENNNQTTSDNDNLFLLESNASKNKIYAGEFVDIESNFYRRADMQKDYNYKPLNFPDNAWIEGIEDINQTPKQVIRNNYKYLEHEMEHKRIFISKSGNYTINPAKMNLTGIIPLDFFSSDEKQYSLATKPINIEVIDLPKNAPEGFDGAVGVFKMHSTINPVNINGKNPASLNIFLEGEGNFQNLKDMGFTADNSLDVFSTKSNIDTKDKKYKTKITEVLLIPSKSGNFKVKTNDFVYFDINKKEYVVLKGNTYNINVKNIESTQNSANNENSDAKANNNSDNVTISYIKTNLGIKNSFFKINNWFFIFIAIYILFFSSLIFFIIFKLILVNYFNCDFYLKKQAYKNFSKNIANLLTENKNNNEGNYIDKISIIIEKYFIDKFNIDSIEFTNKSIKEKLEKFLCADNIAKLKEIITELDIIRFGGHKITDNDVTELLNKIKLYIKDIENESLKKS